MPKYDYRCPSCGCIDEVVHGMNNRVAPICFDCGCTMKRMYSSFNMNCGNKRLRHMINSQMSRETDMKQELQEDHGVEKFTPLRATTVTEVYNDVKSQGSFVKDQMQERTEISNKQREKKQKLWKKKAEKRAPKRFIEMQKKRKNNG